MSVILHPWHLLLLTLAGWINQEQQRVIEYLITENQVLKEKLGRPPLPREMVELVLTIARANPTWGYDRIQGALVTSPPGNGSVVCSVITTAERHRTPRHRRHPSVMPGYRYALQRRILPS